MGKIHFLCNLVDLSTKIIKWVSRMTLMIQTIAMLQMLFARTHSTHTDTVQQNTCWPPPLPPGDKNALVPLHHMILAIVMRDLLVASVEL